MLNIPSVFNDYLKIPPTKLTKEDKKRHGYGINSMRAIAEKYDGFVSLASDDEFFTTNISMANRLSDSALF